MSARPLVLVPRMPHTVLGLANLIQGIWCGVETWDSNGANVPRVPSPNAFPHPTHVSKQKHWLLRRKGAQPRT